MAQGPIAALPSTSTSHGVTVKPSPPINGITYDKVMQNLSFTQGSTTKTIIKITETEENKVGESVIRNENAASEESVDINTEIIETIQDVELVTASIIVTDQIVEPSGSIIKTEIARSIVYGGLTELISSLGIVTSAASTKATTTGKIVAFSLASLISGLFVMTFKISKLWMKKQESEADEAEDEKSERYENVLGDRKNYRLHLTVAILSFVVFGLVPPLVYGFTFRKPEDKILKISTVTIITVFCIGLLGVGKAYIERPPTCVEYVNIIGNCIVDAIGTSVLTTLGGDLIGKYVEQVGWFETNKIPTLLFQPGLSFENASLGAY